MPKEIPIEVVAYQRLKHKQWCGEKKGNVVACGFENQGFSVKIKCDECGEVCYYTPNDSPDLKVKNPKKICLNCVLDLKKYNKFLNKEQRKILEMGR